MTGRRLAENVKEERLKSECKGWGKPTSNRKEEVGYTVWVGKLFCCLSRGMDLSADHLFALGMMHELIRRPPTLDMDYLCGER